MSDCVKVSIVLPAFNGEKYLEQAIDSVLNQSFSNWELILINDCSTDSTKSIMERYAQNDDRIRVINNEKNFKVPKSLNEGFASARGKYFTWTSDDNVLMPNMLEKLVGILDRYSDVGCVYSNMIEIDENGETICDSFFGNKTEADIIATGCGGSFLYRKELALEVGPYDPDLFLVEDYDYWLRIYSRGKVMYLPEALYCFRMHSESQTTTKKELVFNKTHKALWKNYWDIIACSNSFKERRKLYNRIYRFSDRKERHLFYRVILEMNLWMIKNIIWGVIGKQI